MSRGEDEDDEDAPEEVQSKVEKKMMEELLASPRRSRRESGVERRLRASKGETEAPSEEEAAARPVEPQARRRKVRENVWVSEQRPADLLEQPASETALKFQRRMLGSSPRASAKASLASPR